MCAFKLQNGSKWNQTALICLQSFINWRVNVAVDISMNSIFVDEQSFCEEFLLTFEFFIRKFVDFELRIDFIILWEQ